MRCIARLGIALYATVAGLQMAPASAEKRIALVIGNGSYAHIAGLPNVPNDAAAMGTLFKAAKFNAVDVKQNLGVAELRRALREFAGQAADADVAVLFYVGHGIEVGQVNYLVPVDARLVTDLDVEDEAVSLDRVLQLLEPARRLRLVILDACRENPFVRSMKRTVAARSVGRGLGRVEPSNTNTLIAFATKPNAVAEDGKGPNSPFTAALVKHLLTPGLDLRIALGHVRDEVLTSTGNKQAPYVTASLGGGIVSTSADTPRPAAPVPQPLSEAAQREVDEVARERQRLAVLKAELDHKLAEAERQQRIALQQEQARKRAADADARKRDREDCDSPSTLATVDRNIAACSRIIDDPTEGTLRKATAYANRCVEWHSKKDFNQAERDCSEAIRLNPRHAWAYFTRGLMYGSKMDFNRAIADFSEAIRLDPSHADAYKSRALAYEKSGRKSDAIRDYRRALSRNPNDQESRNALRELGASE